MSVRTFEELKKAVDDDESEIIIQNAITIEKPIIIEGKKNMTIRGVGGELNCAKTVDGEFIPYDERISVCEISAGLNIQSVFVNGENYIMARYPDYVEGERLNGCCSYGEIAERLCKCKDVSTGYVRAIHEKEWGGNSYFLRGMTGKLLRLEWIGDNNRGGRYRAKEMMVENVFEELDSPKEWFYDKKTGKLFIYFAEGTDIRNAKVEYCVNGDIFIIQNCENISIENLRFTKTNRTMFDGEYRFVTRSDWSIADRGVILAEDCVNVGIKNCLFADVGGNAVHFKGKNVNCGVARCDFFNIGASGVLMFGDESACRHLSSWSRHRIFMPDKKAGPKNDRYARGCYVDDCYFRNTGIFEKQSAPISLSIAGKCRITGNTVCYAPRAGINICDGSFGGHLIENNDIFETVRETGDHGPFNSWGRDRFWSYKAYNTEGKFGKAKKPFAAIDATDVTVIRHNRVTGARGFGIDLDDGSTNYEICDNYCFGVGIKLREGFFRKVYNNIIIGAQLDLHCTFYGNDDYIHHNVICCKQPINSVWLNRGFTTKVENNLFVNCDSKVLKNAVFKNSDISSNKVCENDISARIAECDVPLNGFKPFELRFGRDDAEKPASVFFRNFAEIEKTVVHGSLVSNVDDGIRTFGGLKNTDGVYIYKAGGTLKRRGVKDGDVILSANGCDIKNVEDLTRVAKFHIITVMRNQKERIIKK